MGLDQEVNREAAHGGRLSRDLERGFRDESDSDEEDLRGGRGRPARG